MLRSHVCGKAIKRIKIVFKEKIKNIVHPPRGKSTTLAILDYNAFVMGEHNYYQVATHVSFDFAKINFEVKKTMKLFRERLKRKPKTENKISIFGKHALSKQLRWLENKPIVLIDYIQTKAPLHKTILRQQINGKSYEFTDNRLSLFCAQHGKCAVTGLKFKNLESIHYHHKKPCHVGDNDNYQNLILVHEHVHTLIHVTNEITINIFHRPV